MKLPFRSSRPNRTYLDRVTAAGEPSREAPTTQVRTQPPTRSPAPATLGAAGAARQPLNGVERAKLSVLEICHPEIARAISLLWGFPEMNEYFDRLWLADNAGGPIDPDAMSDLMLLSRVHQMLLPQRPSRNLASLYGGNRSNESSTRNSNDPWREVPERR
jgi:hypothetical protein